MALKIQLNKRRIFSPMELINYNLTLTFVEIGIVKFHLELGGGLELIRYRNVLCRHSVKTNQAHFCLDFFSRVLLFKGKSFSNYENLPKQ